MTPQYPDRAVPLSVAVVGVGHMGSRHAEIYAGMPDVRLDFVCDKDATKAQALATKLACAAVQDHREIMGRVDAASLAVPTTAHERVGRELLKAGVHLLIEKPIAATLPEAHSLVRTARQGRCVLQVGHVERFNAVIETAAEWLCKARFIEVHRLSAYPSRGTDVSVVLDLMIHDLDLLIAFVRSPVRRIQAVGVPVISRSEDIANARLQFASGCVANLTASRISDGPKRRIRIFTANNCLSIDYQTQTVELAEKMATGNRRVELPLNRRPPLQKELASFIGVVRRQRRPVVSGEAGIAALALALRIERTLRRP
jgi:predicted dehydrogenase